MKLTLCNEVVRELSLVEQACFAAELGYQGLEIAPFTLDAEAPHTMGSAQIAGYRRKVEAAGIEVSGLHWLLVSPADLSITDTASDVRTRTRDVIAAMVTLCAELGGSYLIHGSPGQRRLPVENEQAARDCAFEHFVFAAEQASKAGVHYLLEPLSADQTRYVNTVEEAVAIVKLIDSPYFATMLDCCSGAKAEQQPLPDVLSEHLPGGAIRHVHVNDPNLRAPGQGELDFAPIVERLVALDYDRWVGVEPFEYVPDGPAAAAYAIGTMQALKRVALARQSLLHEPTQFPMSQDGQ